MENQTAAPQTPAGAGSVQETKDAAATVASTTTQEAKRVSGDAKDQMRHLMGQTRDDLQQQAAGQQTRLASRLRDLADELRQMADGSDQNGMARGLVDDVASRAGSAASWLDDRDPGSLLEEARRFARRRPGAFLAIAAGAGVVAGRLSRGLADEARDQPDSGSTDWERQTGTEPGMMSPSGSTTQAASLGQTGVGQSRMGGAAPLTSGAVAGGGTAGTGGGLSDGTMAEPLIEDTDPVTRAER